MIRVQPEPILFREGQCEHVLLTIKPLRTPARPLQGCASEQTMDTQEDLSYSSTAQQAMQTLILYSNAPTNLLMSEVMHQTKPVWNLRFRTSGM